jgi:hypothetical protein
VARYEREERERGEREREREREAWGMGLQATPSKHLIKHLDLWLY